jgi:hypothetical protein
MTSIKQIVKPITNYCCCLSFIYKYTASYFDTHTNECFLIRLIHELNAETASWYDVFLINILAPELFFF